ncbi:SDR family NAD(P)-dependent oxidoreductase [Novosphingobium sp. CECT 9465]|uniref:SDR family NAD(P)-dependent oxidoreductase n=1 Tax=Novosphingobium sp. CECT 9465 TaxID=2829794 RepID=UPI001E3E3492|nr:SDR family oxidoreductase [Novosphingobium sp. CECT 9465]CAH0495305.1 2,5-dichloro-2,5-cyclohexadiene-1,4-diol dehydrogenase LinX [Novosphingobium sp. CECT 9465]
MNRLDGKTAFVTGAGRGIGRAIARLFAAEGARVVVTSRTSANVDKVVAEITATGGNAIGVACDVSREDDITAAIAATAEAFGGLDILVNNAFDLSTVQSSVNDLSVEQLMQQFQTGPIACLRTMQAAYPYLKRSGAGRVINFASSVGVIGAAGFAPYAMAKEAIRALSRVAAREWGADAITVNNILPIAQTDSFDATTADDAGTPTWVPNSPIARLGSPDLDIAPVALFLASADARFMTGYSLTPDGGFIIDTAR